MAFLKYNEVNLRWKSKKDRYVKKGESTPVYIDPLDIITVAVHDSGFTEIDCGTFTTHVVEESPDDVLQDIEEAEAARTEDAQAEGRSALSDHLVAQIVNAANSKLSAMR